jgi:superfamily I DNA/RNA helicase
MKPTPQQQAITQEILNGRDNVLVRARAGCGKTSQILMATQAIAAVHPRAEVTICAFNKAIADEIKARLEAAGLSDWKRYQGATLHSLAFGLLRFAFKPAIDDKKVRNIVKGLNDPAYTMYADAIVKMVDLAKGGGFGFFDDRQINDMRAWYWVADHYDVNGFEETTDLDIVIECAQRVYRMSLKDTSTIDFNDMILMPLVYNLRVKFQRDYLFVDEAQDLSRARQALARKFVKPSGKMIIVGDERQAIYGFSGADSDAMINLSTQLRAKDMPLSVTWRCPKSVVALAQSIVPDIQAAPSAPEGKVEGISYEVFDDNIRELTGADTAMLCRNTAPLITWAYALLRNGIPAKVEGRDIGESLKSLIGRWKVKSIDALLNKVEVYRDRETQKLKAKGKDEKIEALDDKCNTVVEIAKACIDRGKTTVAELVVFIDDMFADGATGVTTLCSYHRSKGREWRRVILIEHYQRCPSKYARQDWQLHQEDNLAYVAFTRSMDELLFLGE